MKPSEIIGFLGEEREKFMGAMSPPIFQTSNFCFGNVQEMREALRNEATQPVYTRGANPTVAILRKKLAALENTDDCLVTASGCAAISTAVISQLSYGDHVVCVELPYGWTKHLLLNILVRFGVETTFVPGTDISQFETALRPNTRLIYLESPNSFGFSLQNLAEVATLARSKGIVTIIDNSYSTPIYQQPANLGIDIIIHTASKYLAGHSDVVAGVICARNEIIGRIFRNEFMTLGGIIPPHDAWLMIRGLRTLELRLNRSSATAKHIIGKIENHPAVSGILYPFHPSHPQYELAKRQMKDCSGMFSILLNTNDAERVEAFCNKLRFFLLAVSWGGFESLVFPALATYSDDGQALASIPPYPFNLVRFYVGLDDPDDLTNDLLHALGEI